MRTRTGLIVAVVVGIAVALSIATRETSKAPAQSAAGEPSLIAATFRSAWCASCKILEPRLAAAMPAFAAKPVEFVVFDFTFGDDERLAALAASHGLTRLYEANKGATGYTVLVDASAGAILDTLTMNFSTQDIERAIADALAVATLTDDRASMQTGGP